MTDNIRIQLALANAKSFAERIHSESEKICYCYTSRTGTPYKCRLCYAADIIAECQAASDELQTKENN